MISRTQLGKPLSLALLLCAGMTACGGGSDSPPPLEIKVVSSRADMVSGGDALIEVRVPADQQLSAVKLSLNGVDKSASLTETDPAARTLRGLVSGMTVGANALQATSSEQPNQRGDLQVINHPITGPVISGPHITPYECRTVESGLGAALDADCSATQKIEYFYRASNNAFKPLASPAGARPADLVTTKTNDGLTVPYIVRVESGTNNRSIYRIAVLDDPTVATLAAPSWKPGPGWNRKLVVTFGGGCGTQYNQGVSDAQDPLNDLALSRGFASAVSTELANLQHCNAVLQGEALMMLKEYFIERYGVPKWTVGGGGSGGAIQQLLIAQMYPGLLDGIRTAMSFPDSSLDVFECRLLRRVYASDAATWTQAKQLAVEGYAPNTCRAWDTTFADVIVAARPAGCALNDTSKVYNPVSNRTGARCTFQDLRVNVLGRDPATGFARRPLDNVGVQFGLNALNSGAITPREFLDLNERIGGFDIDGIAMSQRTVADPDALRISYETGLVNSGGGGLAKTPILSFRNYLDLAPQGNIHTREHDFAIRARLQKANGRTDNHVLWVGSNANLATMTSAALDAMTAWLDAIVADPSPLSADKVARLKPVAAVDACWDAANAKIVEAASISGTGVCNTLYPVHSDPHVEAGGPISNDILKCQLKPISDADYRVAFTDAEKARRAAIFPSGACDYSKSGVGQVALKGTFLRYPF